MRNPFKDYEDWELELKADRCNSRLKYKHQVCENRYGKYKVNENAK